jgi:ketosteroid isomerase-like protein
MSRISLSRSAVGSGLLTAMLLAWSPVHQQRSQAAEAGPDAGLARRLWEDHLEAVTGPQPARIAVADDAVFIYPDLPVLRGREAIQAHLAKASAGLRVLEAGFKLDRSEVAGGRLYTFVTVDERVQEGAAPPVRRHGRYAVVWEQQPDKSWQIAHFLVNYVKP